MVGKACNDEEKVRRLDEEVGKEYNLIEAYSDDKEEILYKAEKGYYLEDDELKLISKSDKK